MPKPGQNGQNPIQIPFVPTTGWRWLSTWCSEVVRCLQQLRDRKPVCSGGRGGGLGSGGCIPWKPSFTDTGVTFNLGLLNQMAATNWDAEIAMAPDVTRWPVLNVNTSNGAITGFTIALDTGTPTTDQIAADTPPSSFKIVLGVIMNRTPCMVVDQNLEAIAVEQFRESRTPPSIGEEPFKRWWRWKVQQNTDGDYPYVT